ncbi:hypothetical protein [Leptolyngbya sp. FACHB-261]|uniref:hypothetical protein n=1 Tax=Leptolyngbya sp. FACHB-261 TaxID=2692806 RepID=UPI0016868E84|nr:hypothetical protein [Leptolyngbya sp. FACHB-261]MBD2103290.1 hypothetical protein [Leptolyngbya sp. FACHB-261]
MNLSVSSATRFQVSSPVAERHHAQSVALLWAKRYIRFLDQPSDLSSADLGAPASGPSTLTPAQLRSQTAQKVARNLPLVTGQALSVTHKFLDQEIRQQRIDPHHLDSLQIAADNRRLFQMVLDVFAAGHSPDHLSAKGSREFGRVRQYYTQQDGRVLGFLGMHVHHTIRCLLEQLTLAEQACFEPYLRVMNDHLYMPLQVAYEAAAEHDPDSPALQAVQALLPLSSEIARRVFEQICEQFPHYTSHSGHLRAPVVEESSLRDVELFQVYLCVCVLEGSIRSVQHELFPLCVMLYPRLMVSWELVRAMIQTIEVNMQRMIPRQTIRPLLPYIRVMKDIFSPEVFEAIRCD